MTLAIGWVSAALALLPASAWAHVASADAESFYAGLIYPFTDADALAEAMPALLALGLLAGQSGRERGVQAALTGVGAAWAGGLIAIVAGWHPAALSVLAWGTLAAALLVAADLPLPLPALLAVTGAVAAALGVVQASTLPSAVFGAGVAVGAGLALLYLQAIVARIGARWARIGVRVAGSWLAAIQLMVLGLTLR